MTLIEERPLVASESDDDDTETLAARARIWPIVGTGALGAALVALSSDLPGSTFGPGAGALWPFAASGPPRGWEGPKLPAWAGAANAGPGAPDPRALVVGVAGMGVMLLFAAWMLLVRRGRPPRSLRGCELVTVAGAWVAPLLLAAPFASQDVWMYGAQGEAVLRHMSSSAPASLLGSHSIWLVGVDPKWAVHPSTYGPGALEVSALFVRISGGRPWIAGACWRLAVLAGLGLCAWGLAHVAARRGGDPARTVVAALFNPGVLVMVVASIHNDAVMIGLVTAGVAMALERRTVVALCLAALAVAWKSPALLGLVAIAWWAPRPTAVRRAGRLVVGGAMSLGALVSLGVVAGGGFAWLRALSLGPVSSVFTISGSLLGSASAPLSHAIELAGIGIAFAVVLKAGADTGWIRRLGLGYVVMALTAATAQPWYGVWALVPLAAGGIDPRARRAGFGVLVAMIAWSELPGGGIAWFIGAAILAWGVGVAARRRHGPRAAPAAGLVTAG